MKIAIFNIYESLNHDEVLFGSGDSPIGDDLYKPFQQLRDVGAQRGMHFSTFNSMPPSEIDVLLFADLPSRNHKVLQFMREKKLPAMLILFECSLIRPTNWDQSRHSEFHTVFTWNDQLVDHGKYKKLNFSHKIRTANSQTPFNDRKLCHLISSNKAKWGAGELYSERIKTIRWFEQNAPQDFDLYGMGWTNIVTHGPLSRPINAALKTLKIKRQNQFPSYKGGIKRKRDVIGNYKFSICYENSAVDYGYITEKIFDCFLNGCIPVYWGAPNIEEHIPADCFIDRRQFSTHEELYKYLNSFNARDFERMINNINAFLESPRARQFSIEYFTKQILSSLESIR